MDHRYSVRLPMHLTVDVFKRERFLGRYITRNMDVEGVFLEMPTADLEPNEVLKLMFVVPDCECCDYTLIAGVVRLDADGAGMMVFDREHKALNILRAADPLNHVSGRGVRLRRGSTNTDDYGSAVKYRA